MKIETVATPKSAVAKSKASQTSASEFAQILNKAITPKSTQKFEAQPATMTRLTKPRSHLELTSLNPVGVTHKPKHAALETIGDSRTLPFVLSSTR
jgi:hypothetical protein